MKPVINTFIPKKITDRQDFLIKKTLEIYPDLTTLIGQSVKFKYGTCLEKGYYAGGVYGLLLIDKCYKETLFIIESIDYKSQRVRLIIKSDIVCYYIIRLKSFYIKKI